MELKDKKVIITGISKGIGKHTCLQLLEKGAHVCGWGLNEPDYSDPKLNFIKTDVKDFESVAKAYSKTEEIWGEGADALINNAGYGLFNYVENFDVKAWHDMFATNVHGIFHCSKVTIPAMRKKESGHIINIASIAGQMGNPQGAGYSGTKFAVRGMSESMFKELRDYGIKVSCVYPGSTNTNFFDSVEGMDAHQYMMDPKDVAQELVRLLETSNNFLISDIIFRPLQPKGPKKK